MAEEKAMNKVKTKNTYIALLTVLLCTYVIPTGIISENHDVSKMVFTGVILLLYFFNIFAKKKIQKVELLIIAITAGLALYTKNANFLTLCTIFYLKEMIKDRDYLEKKLQRSKILYICLAFTIGYSVYSIFNVAVPDWEVQRFARTAVIEINQSAFAILMLGLLMVKKNRILGYLTLMLGCLTLSRMYYLSLIIIGAFALKHKFFGVSKKKLKVSYVKWNFLFFFILMALGMAYMVFYNAGLIKTNMEIDNRLVAFLDYSNFYRFTANILLLIIIKNHPKYFLFGMSESDYLSNCKTYAEGLEIPYNDNVPHNLFLSHLKIYGFMSIIELVITSKLLKQVVNRYNLGIFVVVFLTSNILGCGLYSYWLYLSIMSLILYDGKGKHDIRNNVAV